MKKSKIIVPALGILVLSTAASITGTVAWFSVNSSVTVDGMTVNTKVASNLLIAADEVESTAKKADSAFGTALHLGLSGTLEPVSTVNGSSFFYTTNGLVNGDALEDVYKAYDQTQFRTDYGVAAAVGYVDFAFQLRADNVEASAYPIKLTKLELKYGGDTDANTAFRAAVWTQDITSATPTAPAATASGIYAPSGAQNQADADSKNFAISATNAAPTQLTVSGNKYNQLSSIGTVPAKTVGYYKVVCRFYIEGEDKTCTNSTFASLTEDWSLSLELAIDNSTTTNTNVSALAMAVTA